MLANLLELALQKKLDISKPFIITDYGCGRSKAANILAELIAENSEQIAEMLANGNKIGSTEVADGIKINIDWTALKKKEAVFPEVHHRFHDIHIPLFKIEVMYLVSSGTEMIVQIPFDETKDIGFYHLPETALATIIPQNHWKFVPAKVYHGPLCGSIETDDESVLPDGDKLQVVKICIKILAD